MFKIHAESNLFFEDTKLPRTDAWTLTNALAKNTLAKVWQNVKTKEEVIRAFARRDTNSHPIIHAKTLTNAVSICVRLIQNA